MINKIKKDFLEFKVLIESVPSSIVVLFVISVFSMNLLANKSINVGVNWLALDCGIIVSWFAFLSMDILTKHFGPKASTQISIFAILVNIGFCLIFFVASKIPGVWGESFVDGSEDIINIALNKTFGGTWYVLLGSTIAFVLSAFVNNFSNWCIGKLFKTKPDGVVAYLFRTYISTCLGQFTDNMIFALLVGHYFFGWTILQCVTCSLTGMVVELICEVLFSYLGFCVCEKWKKENVGKEYFELKGKII